MSEAEWRDWPIGLKGEREDRDGEDMSTLQELPGYAEMRRQAEALERIADALETVERLMRAKLQYDGTIPYDW